MAKNSARDIEITAFATHQVITQPNPLRRCCAASKRRTWTIRSARAEQALAGLVRRVQGLDDDRDQPAVGGLRRHPPRWLHQGQRDELFRAAHDIKGDAATFGYPAAAGVAESLCRVIEHAPDLEKVPASCSRTTSTPSSPSCMKTPSSTASASPPSSACRLRKSRRRLSRPRQPRPPRASRGDFGTEHRAGGVAAPALNC